MNPKAHLIAPKASRVIEWHSFQMTQRTNRKAIYLTSVLFLPHPLLHLLLTHTYAHTKICIAPSLSVSPMPLIRTNIETWQHTNVKLNANCSDMNGFFYYVCRQISTVDEHCVTSGNDDIVIGKIKIDLHTTNHILHRHCSRIIE